MKIADIDLGNRPVVLAPMEDVTDQAFRLLCKEFGASMVYSEFVSADALIRSVNRSLEKIKVDDNERPVAIQIYGRDVESMVEAAKIVEAEARPDILDINFGCPVKKVAGKGAGSGMLKNVPLLLDITKAVVDAVKVPVTVKTRLGWDCDDLKVPNRLSDERAFVVELAERLQDCGIKALTLHGRTRSQMYQGEADWTLIGEVKNNPRMTIPIIGNGDICTAEQAENAFNTYGVDAVMIGRATFGQPWLFKDVRTYLDTGKHDDTMTLDWKFDVLKRQVEKSVEYSLREDNALKERKRTELGGIIHVRRHLANSPLFKGIPDFKQTRIKILQAESKDALFALLDEAKEKISSFYGI
ncbi:MAG: tRNA dihydrouridine synthase DusB [Bacteroidaceae bacterium]|nr:tRNA dihydrouridine synthase DusB [Bacteroidaceae bacterium]MBR6196490.1 tRNA dihydrouridine synthase DusB [Bacteroidaceae bacterium]